MKTASLMIMQAFFLVACSNQEAPAAAQTTAESPEPHANLAQLMRGLLYPNSEIIFAAQSEDPEEAAAAEAAASTDPFGGEVLYAGWEGVENAGLMLSEAAALVLVPGRQCENGLPVPLENEDFRMYAEGLIEAGQAAFEAAQTQSMDAMVEVSGVVTEACAACHDVYRDKPEGQMRCVAD